MDIPEDLSIENDTKKENVHNIVFHLFGPIRPKDNPRFSLSAISSGMEMILRGGEEQRRHYRPIFLISSRGGSIEEALQIYTYLAHLPIEVTTVAVGLVESAAVYVYLAGKRRIAMPSSTFLLHEGTFGISDCATNDLLPMARAEKKKSGVILDIIAKSTGNRKRAMKWLRGTHRFTAEEAKQLGFVTEIGDLLFSNEVDFARGDDQPKT